MNEREINQQAQLEMLGEQGDQSERMGFELNLIPALLELARSQTVYWTGFNNPRQQAIEALRMLGIKNLNDLPESSGQEEEGI